MLIQIVFVLLNFAHAATANFRCVLMSSDGQDPLILETKIGAGQPGSGHHFRLVAPLKLFGGHLDHKIEFSAEDVQVCEGEKKAVILSTSDCQNEAGADAIHVEFSRQDSWDNSANMSVPSDGEHAMLVGEFKKVWCFGSEF